MLYPHTLPRAGSGWCTALLLWSCLSAPWLALAQTPAESTAPLQLAPVEVKGQRLGVEQIARDTSTFATVLDTSEATSRLNSVADVLNESVGIRVRRFGGLGAFSTVSIRGSTAEQVEVYLDNVLLNRANAGLVDLGNLPLDNVERIEVYRGFAPLQLGAGSIGGAIHLVTRPVAGAATNSASLSYGSFDTRKATLYRSQGFDRFGYVALFNYTETLGNFRFFDDNGTPLNLLDDETTTRKNNGFRSFNLNTKGEAILAGWQVTLANDVYTKDQGVPGQSSNQSTQARFDTWRDVALLRLEKKGVPWASTDVAVQLSYTLNRERFSDTAGEIGVGSQDLRSTTNTYTANGLLTWYLEPWAQTIGVLLEGSYETFRNVDFLPELRGQEARQGPFQQRSHFTAALQDEVRLFQDTLSLRPLLRYQLVASDFGADPTFGVVRLNTARDTHEHLFNPSLGVKYKVTSWLDLKGNIGRFTRVPTLFELFGDRGPTLGNPELVSERSTNWDTGFVLESPGWGWLDRLYFEYAYFGSKAENLILFVQNSQNTARAENIGAASIYGHEVSWSATALQHVRLFGNYTYQDTEDTSDTLSRGGVLPGRPRHELHQGLELFARPGKLTYELDYIAENFLDRANVFVIDSRLLHNLRITALPFGPRLKLTFEVKNVTDNQIADVRGFPLPGRSFFGTVEGKF
ncbi:MAG: TonB-dependent receptor plug domain-containing protein [Candidatus Tectimicrobiota bacterium]